VKSTIAILLLGTFLAPAAVSAADLSVPLPAPAPIPAPTPMARWTGLHLGAGAGIASTKLSMSNRSVLDFYWDCAGPGPCQTNRYGSSGSTDGRSVFATLDIGYDVQIDRFVLGLGANVDLSNGAGGKVSVDKSVPGIPFPNGSAFQGSGHVGNGMTAYVRGGVLVTDTSLLYALGGYSLATAKLDGRFGAGDTSLFYLWSGGVRGRASATLSGPTVGVGFEQMLTDRVSLKLEYRYTDLGGLTATGKTSSGDCNCYVFTARSRTQMDVTTQSVRAVLSYRFDL